MGVRREDNAMLHQRTPSQSAPRTTRYGASGPIPRYTPAPRVAM